MNSLGEKLKLINLQLKSDVKLLAVSKTFSSKLIIEAYEAGQRDFGENRVMELLSKSQELSYLDIRWHFIGRLQSNKINSLLKVKNLVAIHSIDSLGLLQRVLFKDNPKRLGLFLQYNTSEEEQKSGFKIFSDLRDAALFILNSRGDFFLQGLMTMGRVRTNVFDDDARKCFELLALYKTRLDKEYRLDLELSMGMSQDFKIAQCCGSHWVRIGREIFLT